MRNAGTRTSAAPFDDSSSDPALAGVPGVRDLMEALTSSTDGCVLVRGNSGSGKSLLLATARNMLSAGTDRVHATVESALLDSGPLVLDGAHALPDAELVTLHQLVQRGNRTVVVATEPRPHRAPLSDLVTGMQARGPVIDLRPLTPTEVDERARRRGIALAPNLTRSFHESTAGVLASIDAGLDAAEASGGDESAIHAAVASHLHDALRHLDTDMLAALSLCAFGFGADSTDLATVLQITPEAGRDLTDRVRASAFVPRANTAAPAVRPLVGAALGVTRLRELQIGVLTARLDAGTLDAQTALTLAEAGLEDPRLARFLCTCAESENPARAAELLAAAVRAGADADCVALRRSEANALAGDLDTAETLTDSVLDRAATLEPVELASAVRISAGIAACRGAIERSADLYEWLGPERVGADAAIAATVLLAAGRPDSAAELLAAGRQGPPTSGAAGVALLAEGLTQSIADSGALAMNSLTRAMSLLSTSAHVRLLPDSATAVTALLCLHSGELAHADSVLRRALESDPPSSISRTRHLVLSAWTAMIGGDLTAAASIVDTLPTDSPLHAREALFIHGLRVGLARRNGDVGALQREWASAQPVVAGYSVDLFSLLPLGELWLAAVRVGDVPRIAHLVTQAQELLTRLGEPALWGAALHWYGVQAAILGDNPAQLLPHARALAAAAAVSAYSAGLASAGRVWLRVLRQEADAAEVEAAARELERIGLPWDGARLAGEAALRVSDTRGATTLLQVARSLRDTTAPQPTSEAATPDPAGGTLTEREADVAGLLLLGLTHREIGARLYIAPKTVEHHVARIRRRLGANSRSELLSMLRALGYGTAESSAS
ncbi:DNA-binding CsgD family transcriptional regulator/thioredoxin-like negative regulator of GroEL [Rhodococcus sp. LBL1]|nr:DNA-binding CsgD family transcriptional regulator/thioredoxin-like negative regulator of GroEL [Rhodococcus sp. LBL1]MDH6682347.1 DNA-binding CsgD family transcriptional regulator/thioredoxin-like negative regulator of GroEL [Rhodococcus sp. LBL2]